MPSYNHQTPCILIMLLHIINYARKKKTPKAQHEHVSESCNLWGRRNARSTKSQGQFVKEEIGSRFPHKSLLSWVQHENMDPTILWIFLTYFYATKRTKKITSCSFILSSSFPHALTLTNQMQCKRCFHQITNHKSTKL